MTGDLATYVIFALGILVGCIVANKDFRYKFFKGLRGFLANLSEGARSYNRSYKEGRRIAPRERIEDKPNVQHIYKQTHTQKICPTCQGSRRVYKKTSLLMEGAPGYKPEAIDCPTCDASGKVWD
jgi:hypothetical protein